MYISARSHVLNVLLNVLILIALGFRFHCHFTFFFSFVIGMSELSYLCVGHWQCTAVLVCPVLLLHVIL